MARGTRLDAPGALHHVMVRGIGGEAIFRDDRDRRDYLDRLARIAEEHGLEILAWALMSNHVHLVTRTGDVPLARSMQRLGTGYARAFNERHDRGGYLFQGRYKSIRIELDSYLRLLVRYVHRNPLVAGLVPSLDALERHPWTGHAALMGRAADPFGSANRVLSWFGSDPGEARVRLRAWMAADADDGAGPPERPRSTTSSAPPIHRNAAIRGSGGFVAAAVTALDADPRAGRLALQARWEISDVVEQVCARLAVEPAEVRSGRRTRGAAAARAAACFLVHAQLGVSLSRAAPELGASGSALARGLERGARIARRMGLRLDPAGPASPRDRANPDRAPKSSEGQHGPS